MFDMKPFRLEKRMTMKELSIAVGISESFICLIESKERRPSVEVAKRIAAVLGFDWTRFFEDAPEEETRDTRAGA